MNVQSDLSSFKHLLKQVYSVHSSKVKELENEIKLLKEKLAESESARKNVSVSDCKRCIELEEAFKACKKALNEQSKWFENFGQKFSIFNSSELESPNLKDNMKSTLHTLEDSDTSKRFKEDIAFHNKIELSSLKEENAVGLKNSENNAEKLSLTSNNQNLLNKVMLDDGESFETYTVTFNRNLKLDDHKLDSMILAPDSLSTAVDSKNVNTRLNECSANNKEKSKKFSKLIESSKIKVSHDQENTETRKRLSSEALNEETTKRSKNGNQFNEFKMSDGKHVNSNPNFSNIDLNSEPFETSKNMDDRNIIQSDICPKSTQLLSKKNATTETSLKDVNKETPKNESLTSRQVTEMKNQNTSNQISPSLLPAQANILPKLIDLENLSNDDDFEEQLPNSKSVSSEDSWDTCERKRPLKKNRNTKCIKSTSKYKMTLDAPPLNYKKPNYKQTKLSKSIFQTKSSAASKKPFQEQVLSKLDFSSTNIEGNASSATSQTHLQPFTLRETVKSPVIVDIDATFMPENFNLESPHYNTTNVKKNTVKKSHLKNGNLFSNISFPEELNPSVNNDTSFGNENEIHKSLKAEDLEFKENMDSFDRLPLVEEPNYKYKNDVVRKKAERRQLNGYDCKECEKYYSELGLSEKEKKERMKKCSRHRGKFSPPPTPDHFWELDFPDTEECKARGYLNKTQKVKLNEICDI